MTPAQINYAQKVAIAGLSGGLGGALIGQYASEPPTMGKTILGVVLGAAVIGAGYGIYLRTGGDPSAAMLGLGAFGGYPRNFQLGATPGYRHISSRRSNLGMTLKPGQCVEVG